MAWNPGGTFVGVGVALADDTGLEKAGDEGDVGWDGVRYLIRGINSDKLLDPVLELIGHDVSTAGVVISSRSAHLEVFDHVHTPEAYKRPELLERVPDLRIGVPTVVDDDIEVGAELLYPGVQHCEVALVAREVFDHVHTSEAHQRPELLERVPDLRIGVTTVVDNDIAVSAKLFYPGVQHCEVALVARECLDSIELAFKLRFFYAISIVLSLPQFSFWQ
mmetsp:Transcript_35116/g.69797  ORF Transcript_35116/g.69797 Transcript_35116/m.69797 type:complete len:220 (-) Transcript_35116:231-890(-)